MTALAIQHRDTIIQKLAIGDRLSEIAPTIGVSPQALSKALKTDPEYRDAIEAGFHSRLDVAEKAIEDAEAMVDVTRAGTKFRALAWRAEREFPERWGNKVEHSGPGGSPLASLQVVFVQVNAPQQVQCTIEQEE